MLLFYLLQLQHHLRLFSLILLKYNKLHPFYLIIMFLNLILGPPSHTGMPCIGSPFPQFPAKNPTLLPIASTDFHKAGVVISSTGFITGLVIFPFFIK